MAYLDKKISFFIENQFPRYVRTEGSTFVKFIQYYYEWLESEGQVIDQSRKMATFRDSSITEEKFLIFLRNEFIQNLPKNLLVDERLVMRNIVSFYQAKGTEEAYRLLFRMLYNEDIEFYYPGVDILRASDGRWTVEKYLTIRSDLSEATITNYTYLYGVKSGASAKITRYTETIVGNLLTKTLYINDIFGVFFQDEELRDKATDALIGISTSLVQTTPGKYVSTKGFLSWDKYLQDNFYYQEYSYVIKSERSLVEYRETANKLLHPIGTKLFGSITVNRDLELFYTGNDQVFVQFNRGQVGVDELGYLLDFIGWNTVNLTNYGINYTLLYEYDTVGIDTNVEYQTFQTLTIPPVLQGTISLENSVISTYETTTLKELRNVPIELIGTKKLIVGSNTTFATNFTSGEIMQIIDTVNSANTLFYTVPAYSNTFIKITNEYPFATLSNQTHKKILI